MYAVMCAAITTDTTLSVAHAQSEVSIHIVSHQGEKIMLFGLRTVIHAVNDLNAAKAWYTKLTGHAPYFDEPFYVGFNVGGYELGLIPDEGPDATTYWGVADLDAAIVTATQAGAKVLSPARDVGMDVRVATLEDPFGNRFGLIVNPHFKAQS
jgi:predicted enzyme related to lactoylglutathione lyase